MTALEEETTQFTDEQRKDIAICGWTTDLIPPGIPVGYDDVTDIRVRDSICWLVAKGDTTTQARALALSIMAAYASDTERGEHFAIAAIAAAKLGLEQLARRFSSLSASGGSGLGVLMHSVPLSVDLPIDQIFSTLSWNLVRTGSK